MYVIPRVYVRPQTEKRLVSTAKSRCVRTIVKFVWTAREAHCANSRKGSQTGHRAAQRQRAPTGCIERVRPNFKNGKLVCPVCSFIRFLGGFFRSGRVSRIWWGPRRTPMDPATSGGGGGAGDGQRSFLAQRIKSRQLSF